MSLYNPAMRVFWFLIGLISATAAYGQTSPNWSYGYVPTTGEFNFWFGSKQNVLSYVPLNSAGGPMSGRLITAASTSSISGFNIQPGVTPSLPLNGDMWVTSAGLFVQINGATVGPLITGTTPTLIGPLVVSNNSTPIFVQLAGTVVQAAGLDGATARYELDSYGAPAYFTAVRRDGTNASPSALAANDEIGGAAAFGFNGTANVGPSAVIRFFASETWSSGHQGSYARIATTPTASATMTDALGVENNGGITIPPSVTGGSQGSGTVNVAGGYYQGGAILNVNATPQGRLTLTTGTPVMTSTVSAAGTVRFTPYLGNLEPLWNGANFVNTQCAELSNILANSATGNAGPAAAVASSVYDIFIWSNAGVCTLTRGPAWTNSTTRSAGTALARVNGILTNSIAITNGPGANAGTYVGTVATDGSGATVTWNPGGAASGGTAAVLNVWNMYNRVSVAATVTDSGTSYTYSSATIRQARASAGNQIGFVLGQQDDGIQTQYAARVGLAAAVNANAFFGLGLDSTTTFTVQPFTSLNPTANSVQAAAATSGALSVGVGVHVISANEASDGTNANSFDAVFTNVISALVRM